MIYPNKTFNLEKIKKNNNKIFFYLNETFKDFNDIIIKPNVVFIIDDENEIYNYINEIKSNRIKINCKYISNIKTEIHNDKIILIIDFTDNLDIKDKILSNDYKILISFVANYFSINMRFDPNIRKLKIKKINNNL